MNAARTALMLVLVLTAACATEAPEEVESETVVPVTVAAAQRGTITARIHAVGLVTPAPGAESIVIAPEAARILAMPKGEGDVVHRGDLLVQFDIPSAQADAAKQQAEIARAQARLANAQAALTRADDLFARGVAARREVEQATREVADAEADLAGARAGAGAAQQVAGRSVVRATFDGIVAKRNHNPGDLVEASASDVVLRVVDPQRLEVVASVPVDDAPRVRVGAAAQVTSDEAGPAPGLRVVSHPVAVEPGTATVPVRLAFTATSAYPIGTPLQVAIDAETHTDVVLVPARAVIHEAGDDVVFVQTGDVARRRRVMTGIETADRVEIASGIRSGETVLTTGQNGLPDGAAVRVAAAGGRVPATAAGDPPAPGSK